MARDKLSADILSRFEARLEEHTEVSTRTREALVMDATAEDFGEDDKILSAVSGVETE